MFQGHVDKVYLIKDQILPLDQGEKLSNVEPERARKEKEWERVKLKALKRDWSRERRICGCEEKIIITAAKCDCM